MSSTDRPQVAWKAIEEDADVFSTDGEAAAKVSRVVGDADADVFTGLAVKLGPLGTEKFIPSERVTGIWPDRVHVDLATDVIEGLEDYKDAPAVRWEPERRSGFFSRLFGGGR
jgi:hypothetical protein